MTERTASNNNHTHTHKTYLSVNTSYKYRLSLYFATCYTKGGNKLTWICWLTLAPGQGVLPYRPIRGCAAGQGIVFDLYVLKKVYNLARVCPNQVI